MPPVLRLITTRLLRTAAELLLVAVLVSAAVVGLLHLAPGDPLTVLQGDARITPAVRAAWTQAFDPTQHWGAHWVALWRGVLLGDLGWSWSQQRSVGAVLVSAIPWSLLLMGLALAMAAAGGLLLGTQLAVHDGRAGSRWVLRGLRMLAAVPDAWLALLVLLVFAVAWPLLPMQGVCDPRTCGDAGRSGWTHALDVARHTVLPVGTLALLSLARFARTQRAAVLPALQSPLLTAVAARGVPARRALWRHAVRRALLPWCVTVASSLPQLVGGAVFVERVYGWPGAGTVLLQAVSARDYALVMVLAVLAGMLTVTGMLLVEASAAWLDPRARVTT